MNWLDRYADGGGAYTLDYRLDKRGRMLQVKMLNERGGSYFAPAQLRSLWDDRMSDKPYLSMRAPSNMLMLLEALGDIWFPRKANP